MDMTPVSPTLLPSHSGLDAQRCGLAKKGFKRSAENFFLKRNPGVMSLAADDANGSGPLKREPFRAVVSYPFHSQLGPKPSSSFSPSPSQRPSGESLPGSEGAGSSMGSGGISSGRLEHAAALVRDFSLVLCWPHRLLLGRARLPPRLQSNEIKDAGRPGEPSSERILKCREGD
jgi:hypothetical protein